MSTLLPILLGRQNGTAEIGNVGSVKDPLDQNSRNLSSSHSLESSLTFSQLFHQKQEVDAVFNQLQLGNPTLLPSDEKLSLGLDNNQNPSQNVTSILVKPDPLERFLSGLPSQRESKKTGPVVSGIPELGEIFDPISGSPRNAFPASDLVGREHNSIGSRTPLAQQPQPSVIPSTTILPSLVKIESFAIPSPTKRETQVPETDQALEGQRHNGIADGVLLGREQILTPQESQSKVKLRQVPLPENFWPNIPSQPVAQGLPERLPIVGLSRDGGTPQYDPLLKVSPPTESSPMKPQELFEKATEVGLKRDPVFISRSDTPLKDFLGGTGQVVRSNILDEVPKTSPIPRLNPSVLSSTPNGPSNLAREGIVQQTNGNVEIQEEVSKTSPIPRLNPSVLSATPNGPSFLAREGNAQQTNGIVGFTDPALVNPISTKPTTGAPELFKNVSGSLSEFQASIPLHPNGEFAMLEKGDRSQQFGETLLRTVGLETSGGQGLGMGMNFSSHSNSGFHQNNFANGQSIGLRGSEEPRIDFPAPALQRLQMDVQLAENHRVQLDVGVQNKHVYAGLVTDYSVLRNLATQFVPQLEAQLANIDLELQEFSAELREEQEQQTDKMFPEHRDHRNKKVNKQSHDDLGATEKTAHSYDEEGIHLVA